MHAGEFHEQDWASHDTTTQLKVRFSQDPDSEVLPILES